MPGSFNSLYITEFNEQYDADHDGYLNLVSMAIYKTYEQTWQDTLKRWITTEEKPIIGFWPIPVYFVRGVYEQLYDTKYSSISCIESLYTIVSIVCNV